MRAKFSLLAYASGKRITVDLTKKNPQPPEGASKFYVRYMDVNGKRHNKPVGNSFAHAVAELRRMEAGHEYEKKTGHQLPEEPNEEPKEDPASRGKSLLSAQIETWLARYKGRYNTWKLFHNTMRRFLKSCDRKFLEDITPDDLFKFSAGLEADDLAPQTVTTYFGVVMIFLKGVGVRLAIPTRDRPDYEPRDVERYTTEELDALFLPATEEESLLFKSFLYAGMRRMEMAHLTYADIDFKHSIWSVRAKLTPNRRFKPKSKAGSRRIPVPAFHTEDIHERMIRLGRAATDLVFPNRRGELHLYYIDILHKLAKRAGVQGRVDLHKFRSTCATIWLCNKEKPVDIEEVRKRLGHSNYKMIQRYIASWTLESTETREDTETIFAKYDTNRG